MKLLMMPLCLKNTFSKQRWSIIVFALSLLLASPQLWSAAPNKNNAIDRIVAIVNDDVITAIELALELETIKQQLRQRSTQMPPDAVLEKQVLDRLVVTRIQLQRAERRLLKVDDETLNSAIDNIASQNGLGLSEFRRALESSGMSYSDYRARVRDEMVIARLQQREVRRQITVTDQEIEDFLANRDLQTQGNDEYRLQHILLAVPEAAAPEKIQAVKQKAQDILNQLKAGDDFAQIAIAQSDGQQALNGGDLGWRKLAEIPSLFSSLVKDMQQGDFSELIRSPSGFHIIKLAETRSSDVQHIVNQTLARHILVKTSDLVSSDEALEKVQLLKQRISSGEDFARIATANSDDKGSAADGGNLGWVNPGTMVKEFEEAMDKLQPGEISVPVKTQFGWHLILVEDRRKHDNTEAFLRNQARQFIMEQKIGPALENWIRQIKDESFVQIRL